MPVNTICVNVGIPADCSTIMSTEFAIFVPGSKCFNTLSIHGGKLMVSVINQNDGVHAVHECQAILRPQWSFPIHSEWRTKRS